MFQNSFLFKSLSSIIKIIIKILRNWNKTIVGIALNSFAIYITVKFIFTEIFIPFYIILGITITSLVIFLLSFIIFKFFPYRFFNWNLKEIKKIIETKNNLGWTLFVLFYISPLANYFMSFSLSVFIFSFMNSGVKYLWDNSISEGKIIYEYLASFTLAIPIIILLLILLFLISGFLAYAITLGYEKIRMNLLPYFIYSFLTGKSQQDRENTNKQENLTLHYSIFTVLLVITVIFFEISDIIEIQILESLNTLVEVIANYIQPYLILLIKFIVGIIPLGWFYELFVSSSWISKELTINPSENSEKFKN